MKKRLTETGILDKWLGDYHSTSIEQILIKYYEWAAEPEKYTRIFYDTYQVTQEQHDEWCDWMVRVIAKQERCSLKYAKRITWAVYLNTAPSVIKSTRDDTNQDKK